MGKAIYAVVGIDFGTTYSGVAWALEGNPEDIEIISSWPGGGNRTTLKVPSVISYENKVSKWGYQVGPLSEVIRGSKLLLDEHQDQEYAPSLASKPLLVKYGKDAVQVSGDYLKNLVVHVKATLERRFGESAKSMELIYVLTVPAVWSDKAKDATLRAAFLAGVESSQVSLVSEPEAAALHSLRTIQPNSISKEDVLIVCDAGGGTVDLISYKVRDIAPLNIEEVTEGTGAVCGSLLLDERFERLLMRKVGLENWQCLRTQSKESALSYWRDMVKPNFGEESECDYLDVDHFIPLPGAESQPDKHIEDGFVQLDSEEIEEIFEPIVMKVEELVRMQLERVADLGLKVKAIVLVGGFGSSRYLFQRLKIKNPSITVMQPPNAWAAVVSGAVSRGLEGNRVEARVSRRSYGVSANKKFDQTRHAKHAKYWSHTEEEWFARDNMIWYIKKSARVSEHQPIKFDFYRTVFVDQADELRFSDELFFCNDKSPPDIKCGRVIPLCTLNSDLSKIPRQLFRRKTNSSGNEYYEISYALKVTPASASLLFDLEFNGVSYGSVSSRY